MKELKKKFITSMIIIIPLICIISIGICVINFTAWHIEGGYFVRSELHPERQVNVTWIVLEDKTLMYGSYNSEVLDLIPGKYYWFGEGLVSGNYGKRLLWITDENPVVNATK